MRDLDKYQELYMKEPFEPWQVKMRKKKLLEILSEYPHKHMLEVGCGLEPIFTVFEDLEQLTVLEPGDEFYANAKKVLVEKNNQGVELRHQSLEEAQDELKGQHFDLILLSSLLHEVENPEELLKIVHELSDENTVTIVNVPNAHSFHRMLAVEMGITDDVHTTSENQKAYQQHRIFDMASLKTIVKDHGFQVMDSGSYFIKPFTHDQMGALMGSGIIDEAVLEGLYGMVKHMPELGSEIYVNIKRQ